MSFEEVAAFPLCWPEGWRSVLGARTKEEAEAKYRELVKVHHPDAGGSAEQFVRLTNAIEAARRDR
jgi:hypothetical protein